MLRKENTNIQGLNENKSKKITRSSQCNRFARTDGPKRQVLEKVDEGNALNLQRGNFGGNHNQPEKYKAQP